MANPFVNEIRENDRVRGVFAVKAKNVATGKTGKPYANLILTDRTGDIDGKIWDRATDFAARFERGDCVEVDATATSFNGKLQLRITDIRKRAAAEIDPALLLPASAHDPEEMAARLLTRVKAMENRHIAELLTSILTDSAVAKVLLKAPAAKTIHHAWVSGLLEHMTSVVALADTMCDLYPAVNRDLVVTGAILHDMAKCFELAAGPAIDYTDTGRLVGHLIIGIELIEAHAARIPGFPEPLKIHLKHIIAAHHGKLEFGSPQVPKTLEAVMVHAVDDMDSKLNTMGTALADVPPGERFGPFHRALGTAVYRRPAPPVSAPSPA